MAFAPLFAGIRISPGDEKRLQRQTQPLVDSRDRGERGIWCERDPVYQDRNQKRLEQTPVNKFVDMMVL